MPYLIHHTNDLHTSRTYNHLRSLGINKHNVKVLYYLITYYIFTLLVFTFEIPLIYRITNTVESILYSHLIYFFGAFLGLFIFYFLRLKLSLSTLFRINMLFNVLLSIYLLVFYTQINSLFWILPLFILRGVGVSSFSLGFHTSFTNDLKDRQRDGFSLLFRSIYTILPIFLPLIGGYIISNFVFSFFPNNLLLPSGYFPLFIFGFILSLLFLFFSPKMKTTEDFTGGIVVPIKLMFNKRISPIRNYLIFNAGVDALKVAVYGLLGFLILTNELNLGIFSSILALIGSIYFLLVNKIEKTFHIKRIKFFVLGLFGDLVTQIILLLDATIVGLTIRSIASTLLTPLKAVFGINIIRKRYDTLSEELRVPKVSFILFQEICYFSGRLVGFSVLILFIKFITPNISYVLDFSLILFIFVDIIEYFFIEKVRAIK